MNNRQLTAVGVIGLLLVGFLPILATPVHAQQQSDDSTDNSGYTLPDSIQSLLEENPTQATKSQVQTVEKWYFENKSSIPTEVQKQIDSWLSKARDLPPAEDKDGDGVINRQDLCDDQKGSIEENGCPVVSKDTQIVLSGSESGSISILGGSENEDKNYSVKQNVGRVQVLKYNFSKDTVTLTIRTKPSVNEAVQFTVVDSGDRCDKGFCDIDRMRLKIPAQGVVKMEMSATPYGVVNDQAVTLATPGDMKYLSDDDEPLIGDGKIPVKKAGIGVVLFLFGILARVGYLVYQKNETGDAENLSGMKIRKKKVGVKSGNGGDDDE